MLPLHFGLGSALAHTIEIRWPDGKVTHHRSVPTDTTWLATYPG
jgi:hypothetical protein